MTHNLIVVEIDKQLFYVRNSVFRIFQYELYPFLIREFPRVNNISFSLLIGIMRSELDRGDFDLCISFFC